MKNTDIKNVYFGTNEAVAVYYGDGLVWQKIAEGKPGGMVTGLWADYPYSNYNEYNGKPYIHWNNTRYGNLPNINGDGYFAYSNAEKLTDASHMFANKINKSNYSHTVNYNYNLQEADVSKLDFSGVTKCVGMFNMCVKLKAVTGLNGLDTSSLVDVDSLFDSCENITDVDISGWNTEKIKYVDGMFYGCISLEKVTLPIQKIKQYCNGGGASGWFSGCVNLKTIINLNFDNSFGSSSYNDFYDCRSLTTVTGNPVFSGWSSNPTDLRYSPLTNASAMVFINGLKENTTDNPKITFKSTTYDTLTEEQIATATSKGWTVVRSA